jgi:hypothetical protein
MLPDEITSYRPGLKLVEGGQQFIRAAPRMAVNGQHLSKMSRALPDAHLKFR